MRGTGFLIPKIILSFDEDCMRSLITSEAIKRPAEAGTNDMLDGERMNIVLSGV